MHLATTERLVLENNNSEMEDLQEPKVIDEALHAGAETTPNSSFDMSCPPGHDLTISSSLKSMCSNSLSNSYLRYL